MEEAMLLRGDAQIISKILGGEGGQKEIAYVKPFDKYLPPPRSFIIT